MDYRIPHNLLVVTDACPTAHKSWRRGIRVEEMIDKYLSGHVSRNYPGINADAGLLFSLESLFYWIVGSSMGGRFTTGWKGLNHWQGVKDRLFFDGSLLIANEDPIISLAEYRRQAIRALREIVRNYRKTVRKYA